MPYGVSSLSGLPSSLGWLFSFGFPRAGVRMLAAPVTHRVPLPDVITPCCKSSLHFGQTIRAWFKWLVVFTGTLGLERCRCALWLHPPSKAFPWVCCLVCGSLISGVRLICSTRKVQGSRQKVAQVFGRHVACNPAAFCWLAVPVARGQVANAVTAPLSCEGVAGLFCVSLAMSTYAFCACWCA